MKGIILLNQNLKESEQENTEFLFYCGLISHQPTISLQEVRAVLDFILINCPDFLNWLKQEAINSAMNELKIKELYQQAIGELGLSLNDFYAMTPEEIESAYQGFIYRKELEINLAKTAIIEGLQGNTDIIHLLKPLGYTIGDLKERKQVFTKLNIKEQE